MIRLKFSGGNPAVTAAAFGIWALWVSALIGGAYWLLHKAYEFGVYQGWLRP